MWIPPSVHPQPAGLGVRVRRATGVGGGGGTLAGRRPRTLRISHLLAAVLGWMSHLLRCIFGAKLRRFVIVKLAPIHTLVNHS